MKRIGALIACLLLGAAVATSAGPYDPSLDGWKQIQSAGTRAAAGGKRVLVIVGGNWCTWCRALDRLMREDPALRAEVERRFEVVHLNWSKENKNPEAMTRLGSPDKLGFPSLVVLSPALAVLKVQSSGVFETRGAKPGHDPAKLLAFLKSWDGREQSPRRTSS